MRLPRRDVIATGLVAVAALGLVALVGGVVVLAATSDVALAVLMGAMVVLWVIATRHHAALTR